MRNQNPQDCFRLESLQICHHSELDLHSPTELVAAMGTSSRTQVYHQEAVHIANFSFYFSQTGYC